MSKPRQGTPSATGSFRLRYTKGILFLCVLAVILAVVVNVFVAQLPARYTRFDTTDIKLYSVSDLTRQIVSGLEEDVRIYMVSQYGQEDPIVRELLYRYADLSGHIRVEQIDPVLQPDRLAPYGTSLEANSVIVARGSRFRVLKPSRLYVETKTYVGEGVEGGYTYDSYFAGEQEITSAISFVTGDKLPRLYQLTGHGEQPLPDYVQTAIKRENIEVQPLHLATLDAVPGDADLLLLYAPERDLLEQESKLILTYLQNGGKMMIVGGNFKQPAPYFDAVVSDYGVARLDGIVAETNSNYFLEQYPTYVLANIGSHPITQPLVNQGYFIVSPMSQGLAPIGASRQGVSTSALLYTTDAALSVSADQQAEQAEPAMQGPFTIGLALEEAVGAKTTRLVWFTSPYLLLEDVNALSSGANLDLFLNSLSWMYDFDKGISIRSKTLLMDYLTIRSTTGLVLGIVMIAVIPLLILIAGGIVLRRRGRC